MEVKRQQVQLQQLLERDITLEALKAKLTLAQERMRKQVEKWNFMKVIGSI